MVRVLNSKSGAPHQSEEGRGEGRGEGGSPAPIHRYTVPSSLPRSAYRRICLLDRRIGVSAYICSWIGVSRISGRIGVSAYFFPRTGISASGVPAYARIGVSQPRPPPGVSAYRMCPLRAMRRRFGVSAQGGFATLFAGTLVPHRAIVYYAYPLAFLCRSCHPHASLRDAARWSWNQSGHRRLGVVGCGNRVQPVIGILQGSN